MTATRKIVRINEDKCDGCGLCVPACQEGAIGIIDGKARLISETYCDGLGACLGECPRDAITIEERPADEFDPEAVEAHLAGRQDEAATVSSPASGCPGAAMRELRPRATAAAGAAAAAESQLANWPLQLALVPPNAPYFPGAELLVSADCVPFALADFHGRLLTGGPVVIACPKLDDRMDAYIEKLQAIFTANAIRSVTVAHMEVPCCGGIVQAVRTALARAGREDLEFHDVTVGIDGRIVDRA